MYINVFYDEVAVVGVTFDDRQEIIKKMPDGGVSVKLEPEPENPHDPNAIKVIWEGQDIGYMPKFQAEILSNDQVKAGARLHAELKGIYKKTTPTGIVLVPIITVYEDIDHLVAVQESAEKPKQPEIVEQGSGANWRI